MREGTGACLTWPIRITSPLSHTHALQAVVFYQHWSVSHLAHHAKVATPEDPASSRRGESLYAFVPRSVWGNLVRPLSMLRGRCGATW